MKAWGCPLDKNGSG